MKDLTKKMFFMLVLVCFLATIYGCVSNDAIDNDVYDEEIAYDNITAEDYVELE